MKKMNEQILQELQADLKRLNTTSETVYNANRTPSHFHSVSIQRRFGLPWKETIKTLGLQPSQKRLPHDLMINALRKEFIRINGTTKQHYTDFRNKDLFPHPKVLVKHLNMTWTDIIKECELTGYREITSDSVSDEELISEYKSVCRKLNKVATVRELIKHTQYTYDIYRQHFGTITELRLQSGHVGKGQYNTKFISKSDCLKELAAIYRRKGRLSYSSLKKESSISMSTIFRKFGTTKINHIWDEVINSTNMPPLDK